jgi:hypothetical protein
MIYMEELTMRNYLLNMMTDFLSLAKFNRCNLTLPKTAVIQYICKALLLSPISFSHVFQKQFITFTSWF